VQKQVAEKLWTKDYIFLFLTNFFMTVGGQMLMSGLPLFALHVLDASDSQVGSLVAVYSFAALLIRPFAGYSYDQIGRKITYLLSLLIFALLAFGHLTVATFFWLVVFRVLTGITFGVASAGGPILAADLVHPSRRAEGVGYFTLSLTFAMAIAPYLGVAIIDTGNYYGIFTVTGILFVLSFLSAALVKYPPQPIKKAKFSWESCFEKRILSVAILTMLMHVLMGGILSFAILFGEELGVPNAGWFFILNSVGVVITRMFAGKIQDRHGPRPVILFAFVMLVLGFVLLSLSTSPPLFYISALIIGLGNGSMMPSLQAMIFNMVVPERRGAANSTYFAALDIGVGSGSVILGFIANHTGYATMFLACALFLVIPFLCFWFYTNKDYEIKAAEIKALEVE